MSDDFDPQDPAPPDLDKAISSVVEKIYDIKKLGRVEKVIANALSVTVAAVVLMFFKLADPILDKVGIVIDAVEQKASLVFSPLLARIVGHVVGADVSTDAIHERLNRSGDGAVGRVVAETFLEILRPPAGELAPGDEGSRRVLGAIGHMTVNGWAEPIILEWAAQYLGWDVNIESVTRLAEDLIHNLGINRIASQAMLPYAQVAIRTPLLWKLHKAYRPTLLAAPEAIRAFYADVIDESTMLEVLQRQGLGDDSITALRLAHAHHLAAADVDLLVRQEMWTQDEAIQELRNSGMDDATARRVFALEDLKNLRTFQIKAAELSVAAFADDSIDQAAFELAIAGAGLDQKERDRLLAIGHHRRESRVKDLTRAEAEQAVLDGILNVIDYREWLSRHNYREDASLTLELMLRHKINALADAKAARDQAAAQRAADKAARQQAAQAKRDLIAGEHAHFSGAPAQAERLVERGLLASATYRSILIDHGIAPADASALAELAQQKADAFAAAAARRAQLQAKQPGPFLSIAALEGAVKRGVLSLDGFDNELAARKYSAEDIALLTGVLERDLADQAAREAQRAAAAAKLATKSLSLVDEERAVRDGLLTLDQFRAWLTGQKFTAGDVALLVGLLQQQLDADAHARALRDAAAAKLASSHLSLAQEEQAVLDNVQTLDNYSAYLTAHGFHAADVAILVALLQEKIADTAAAAAAHTNAATALGAKGLSLAETEAATIAGVLTLDQFGAFLTRNAFSPADVATLEALLQPKVLQAAQGRARAAALALEPGEKGANFAQRRKAVLDGVSTVADFDVWLQANEYADADRALLVADLEAALAQKANAGNTKGKVPPTLGAKGLSLAQMQTAVKDGLRTLADYQAALEHEGFSPEDVATLVDELAQQLPPAPTTGA